MKSFINTIWVVLIYCVVWSLLEVILYGQVQYRIVDDIMMMLFTPMIHIAMVKLEEK